MKSDREAALFSLKCFGAAMLAYYVSLRIGLTRPYWAIGTVYIVSQPYSGASISRGVFRFLGTLTGAAATVFLVPTFANEPLLLSIALASWIGFCLYVSLLERTPRSYPFLLAGYTASLIGFPSVGAPGGIFNVASTRVQEISIGILFATLAHSLVLPRSVTDRLQSRVAAILADAERWTHDTLTSARDAVLDRDRVRLALDMLELHQLSVHLPFDTARTAPAVRVLRALHDRLLVVLLCASAIEDTLVEFQASRLGRPADLAHLFGRVRSWLDSPEQMLDPTVTDCLLQALRWEEPSTSAPAVTWHDLLRNNLLSNLCKLVLAHRDCRFLQQQLTGSVPRQTRRLTQGLIDQSRGYVFHRDHWLAARAAVGTVIGTTLGCIFWITSAWPDGASAISIMGTLCALFGNADAPAGNVARYLIGSIVGVVIGLVYGFVILPRTTDFVTLVAVLAPTLLVSGSIQARAPLTFAALGMVLTFPIVAELGETNASNFLSAINGGLALLTGSAMALVSVVLFQTISIDYSSARILRAIWRDVARRANGKAPDTTYWTSRMLDRIGLLVPRLARGDTSGRLLRRVLADLRSGGAAGELRTLEQELGSRRARPFLAALLSDLAAHFTNRTSSAVEAPPNRLLTRLDDTVAAFAAEAEPVRRRGLALLTSLRRDLFPRTVDYGTCRDEL
jgi:uncharacterized membrane protein YccC